MRRKIDDVPHGRFGIRATAFFIMRIDESHDAWMNRRVEPHADSNFSLCQVIDECTLVVDPKWIAQIHGLASLRDGRRREAAFRPAPVTDLRDRVPPREVAR